MKPGHPSTACTPTASGPNEFNPGPTGAGRFHFFGKPAVPVLYLAETREAALAETLLRNIPIDAPYPLRRSAYENSVMVGMRVLRSLRMAEFFGLGLRKMGVEAAQLTASPGASYPQTRHWARAAMMGIRRYRLDVAQGQ